LRLLRISALVLLVLGSVGWLMADPVDPIIKLTIPGTGTFDLCTVALAGDTCTTILVSGVPDTTIGPDGFASFAVKNVDAHTPTPFTVDVIDFFFQTNNLFQPFSASSNDYAIVSLVRHFNEGCTFETTAGCLNPVGTLEVDFSGTPKPGDPGSDSLAAITCFSDGNCPTDVGFVPGSDIRVDSRYNIVPDPLPCCDGIQPGEEAGVSITRDTVPEPASFVLLFGAAGLLAIKRRFRRT
jgi:hypothetical protein